MKVKEFNKTASWCSKIISPQAYYLHNKVGGKGWQMRRTIDGWELTIDNKSQALLAILKFSETA